MTQSFVLTSFTELHAKNRIRLSRVHDYAQFNLWRKLLCNLDLTRRERLAQSLREAYPNWTGTDSYGRSPITRRFEPESLQGRSTPGCAPPPQVWADPEMRPFLKEFVKCERFPSGSVRTGNALRCRMFLVVVVGAGDVVNVDGCGFVSVVVAAGSCDRSFQWRLLPNHSFARYHARVSVSSSAWSWQTQMCLVRIPPEGATPISASCS